MKVKSSNILINAVKHQTQEQKKSKMYLTQDKLIFIIFGWPFSGHSL